MNRTIDHATGTTERSVDTADKPKRRRARRREEVVRAVTPLAARGLKRPEIARILGMDDARDGALCRALRRAGRHDLARQITPSGEPTGHRVRVGGIVRWMAA